MKSLRAGFGLFVVIVLASCGGGGDDGGGDDAGASRTPETAGGPNTVEASRMLLGIEDYPDGWDYRSPTSEYEDAGFDQCETADAPSLLAIAHSGGYANDFTSSVSEHILLFEDEAGAAELLETMDERGECLVQHLESGGADTTRATFSNAASEPMDVLDFGDGASRIRVTADTTVTNPNSLTGDGEVVSDFVYVALGRVGILVFVRSSYSPYDTAALEDVVALAVAKAAEELDVVVVDPRPERPDETAEPERTQAPTRPPVPTVGNDDARDDPVARGETGTVLGLSARVIDVNFDAEELVLAENQFNDPAKRGKVMVMVTLEVTNVGDQPLDVYDPTLSLVGSKDIEYPTYDPPCGVTPDELEGVLEPGQSVRGNVCMQPDEDDTDLLLSILLYRDDDFEEVVEYFALE